MAQGVKPESLHCGQIIYHCEPPRRPSHITFLSACPCRTGSSFSYPFSGFSYLEEIENHCHITTLPGWTFLSVLKLQVSVVSPPPPDSLPIKKKLTLSLGKIWLLKWPEALPPWWFRMSVSGTYVINKLYDYLLHLFINSSCLWCS